MLPHLQQWILGEVHAWLHGARNPEGEPHQRGPHAEVPWGSRRHQVWIIIQQSPFRDLNHWFIYCTCRLYSNSQSCCFIGPCCLVYFVLFKVPLPGSSRRAVAIGSPQAALPVWCYWQVSSWPPEHISFLPLCSSICIMTDTVRQLRLEAGVDNLGETNKNRINKIRTLHAGPAPIPIPQNTWLAH